MGKTYRNNNNENYKCPKRDIAIELGFRRELNLNTKTISSKTIYSRKVKYKHTDTYT